MSGARKERADAKAAQFDFNDSPALSRIAAAATPPGALERLLARLEEADDALSAAPGNPRPAALGALRGIVEFLAANPHNDGARFSRVLELLWGELAVLAPAATGQILPPFGGGSGGSLRRLPQKYLKACAAFAVETMHRAGLTVDGAAAEVAALLSRHGFAVGGKRDDPAKGVKAWRRDFRRGAKLAPVPHYRTLLASPPVRAEDRAEAVLTWLANELERAGYEAK